MEVLSLSQVRVSISQCVLASEKTRCYFFRRMCRFSQLMVEFHLEKVHGEPLYVSGFIQREKDGLGGIKI